MGLDVASSEGGFGAGMQQSSTGRLLARIQYALDDNDGDGKRLKGSESTISRYPFRAPMQVDKAKSFKA